MESSNRVKKVGLSAATIGATTIGGEATSIAGVGSESFSSVGEALVDNWDKLADLILLLTTGDDLKSTAINLVEVKVAETFNKGGAASHGPQMLESANSGGELTLDQVDSSEQFVDTIDVPDALDLGQQGTSFAGFDWGAEPENVRIIGAALADYSGAVDGLEGLDFISDITDHL